MSGVLVNISARNPQPGSILFFEAVRGKAGPSKNRRALPEARVVVLGRKDGEA